jgi:RNA polymerase sigma factor (sigma-70 family)
MHEEKRQKFMFKWRESRWIFDKDSKEWVIDNDNPKAQCAEDFVFWYLFNRLDRDYNLAQDLQAEVALKAYDKFYQCRDNFRAWVESIALNELRAYYRKKKQTPLTISVDREESDEDSPVEVIKDKKLVDESVVDQVFVHQCLEKLKNYDPFAFECFMLSFKDGLKQIEMCEQLGKTSSSVNRAMIRAREFLETVITGTEKTG